MLRFVSDKIEFNIRFAQKRNTIPYEKMLFYIFDFSFHCQLYHNCWGTLYICSPAVRHVWKSNGWIAGSKSLIWVRLDGGTRSFYRKNDRLEMVTAKRSTILCM